MNVDPMTKDEQAVIFNCILRNQITIMSALEEIRYKTTKNLVSQFQNIPEEIQKTKNTKRIVEFVERW